MTKIAKDDVLIAIDVQNDFIPGGALAVAGGDAVVPLINGLSHRFDHYIVTQDWHSPRHNSFASAHKGKKPFETTTLHYGELGTGWSWRHIAGGVPRVGFSFFAGVLLFSFLKDHARPIPISP